MKDYYDILEVSRKASKEVIDRAYKVLIKKNHPDKHIPDLEKQFEKNVKEINEAYEVLSNDFLREQYDKALLEEEYNAKRNTQEVKQNKNSNQQTSNQKTQEVTTEYGMSALIKLLFRKRNFENIKNKSKEELKKDFIAMGLTLLVIIVLGIILYFLPFTHNWMQENVLENPLVQAIKNIFT